MQQDKTKPIHGLEKVPDSILLKNSQRELGEYKSYCEELEDKVRDLEAKLAEKTQYYELSEEEKREVSQRMRETEIHKALKEQIRSLNLKVNGLKITNRQLLNRIIDLQKIEEPSRRKEYLLCAAIRRVKERDCHRVYWEQYHDIYKIELGWRHPDIMHRFGDEVSRNPNDQGFYTSKGRFVTREEGLEIARAAGQVDKIIGGVLTSEDLY